MKALFTMSRWMTWTIGIGTLGLFVLLIALMFNIQQEQASGFRTVAVCVFLGVLLLSELMTVQSVRQKPIRLTPVFISLVVTVSFLISLVPEASALVWSIYRPGVVSVLNVLGEVTRKANLLSAAFLVSIVVFWGSSFGRPMVPEEYPKAGRRQWLCLLLAAMVTSMAEGYYVMMWLRNNLNLLVALAVAWVLFVTTWISLLVASTYDEKSFRPEALDPESTGSYSAGKAIVVFGMMLGVFPLLVPIELFESVLGVLVVAGMTMTMLGGSIMWFASGAVQMDMKQSEGGS